MKRWLARRVRLSTDCGVYVNDARLRTEIILPNPAVLTFYGPDGRTRRRRFHLIRRGHNRVVDVARIGGLPAFGQVKTHYVFPAGLTTLRLIQKS